MSLPRPLRDQVVLKRDDAEEVTTGGILLADTAKRRPHRGVVKAVGPGRRTPAGELVPVELAVGDRVVYETHPGGVTVRVDGEEFVVIPEDEILAVLS